MPDRRSLAASLRVQAAAAVLMLAVPFASADASTAPSMEPDESATRAGPSLEDGVAAMKRGSDYLAFAILEGFAERGYRAAEANLGSLYLRGRGTGRDPAAGVRGPKLKRPLPKALDADQVAQLLDSPAGADDDWAIRDQAIMELFYSSGLRLSELVGLDLADVDAGSGELRVLGKGAKTRVVPVGRKADAALKDWIKDRGRWVGSDETALFVGKSGKTHCTKFQDRRLARIVKACQDLRGQRLFQYQGDDGQPCPITSGDVNDYLRQAMGEDFTAKDFRTWAGTVEAARILCSQADTTATRATVTACVKDVARRLGNTPAVCRKAYIHPAVTDAFENRTLELKEGASQRAFETAVIRLLER